MATDQAQSFTLSNRYIRSIHLVRDYSSQGIGVRDYQVTPLVLQTLGRIVAGLHPTSSTRAFSIIGPYGSGKSAFGVFLAFFLRKSSSERRRWFAEQGIGDVPDRSLLDAPSLLPVLVSGNNASLRSAILEALTRSLSPWSRDGRLKLPRLLADAVRDPDIDPQRVADLFQAAGLFVKERTRFHGFALIVDELGQFLDYAARQTQSSDLFALQTLAESVARSSTTTDLIVTILHQTFDRYAASTSATRRDEWAKVQGRYVELPFQEPPSHLIRMTGRALCSSSGDPFAHIRSCWADTVADTAWHLGLHPPDSDRYEWRALVAQAYPLHPTVLMALPSLMRQLAQNERSLFAFLTSHEPWSVPDFLTSVAIPHRQTHSVYRLPHLYSYVATTLGAGLFTHARGQRWAEIAEARALLSDDDPMLTDVLTTIGVLNALGQEGCLRASRPILSFALADQVEHEGIERALAELEARKHITYRRHRAGFVLWEGSDLDIDGMVQEARQTLEDRYTPVHLLQRHAPTTPFVARRHSYRTGAVRLFRVRFVDAGVLHESSGSLHDVLKEADGEVICVVSVDDEAALVEQWALHPDRAMEPWRIVVLPLRMHAIREIVGDVAALEHVLHTRPELEHDRVARREVSARLAEAQQALNIVVRDMFGWKTSRWFWCGREIKAMSARMIDETLSQACDATYALTPRFWNELVVRRQVSSSAAKARRNLIEAMAHHRHEELLGLTGFPPERAIYESILRQSGLHRRRQGDRWGFGAPFDDDPLHVRPTWDVIQQFFASTEDGARPLTELYARLEAPPYGIKTGLLPILVLAAYLEHEGELAIYEHGTYVLQPDIALFERMLRQPGYFSIRRMRVTGVRAQALHHLARSLVLHDGEKTGQPALLDVVKSLFRHITVLPAYTRNTHRLGDRAIAVRQAFLEARAPDTLLFDLLPKACGLAPFPPDGALREQTMVVFCDTLHSALQELQGAYPRLVAEVGEQIRRAFGSASTDDALREELLHRSTSVAHLIGEPIIRALGVRLAYAGPGQAWIESVAALVGRKPLETWNDDDVKAFRSQIADIGRRFQMVEDVAFIQGTAPPETPVIRIGIANGGHEYRRVIRLTPSLPEMDYLRTELRALLKRYPMLNEEQCSAVLAETLQEWLQSRDSRGEEE
ncbi:MAG: hypothetical protein ACUVWS_12090 [Roseiflexus sp.]